MRPWLAGATAAVVGTAMAARARSVWAVAPDLRRWSDLVPYSIGNRCELALTRRVLDSSTEPHPAVAVERQVVDGVPVLIYRHRDGRPEAAGALVWVHGGGFVGGSVEEDHDRCSSLAYELGIVVVSVDYRLAPEHPFPAALDDCYRALCWVHRSAEELGVDRARIAVGGASAGGGIAAALVHLAHDRDEVPVVFQLLVYPMLDDRTALRRPAPGVGRLLWRPRSNRFGWTSYLGRAPRHQDAPHYAAPARRETLTGLPPAWIGVGDLDLFHDENVAYAERLTAQGVPVQLEVQPRMHHAADQLTDAPTVRRFRSSMVHALGAALRA